MLNFQEDLLQYVWKLQYYNFRDIYTTEGHPITILHPGFQNHDAGPDFSSGKIILDGAQWIGNIEIHIKSSDWNKHRHSDDPAYDNIILHVVYEDDTPIYRKDGTRIPTIELKGKIQSKTFQNYLYLQNTEKWIPCENMVGNIDPSYRNLWLETVLVERLENKCASIMPYLEQTNYDWEKVLFILLGKYLGSRVNALPFELLCKSISLERIRKNSHNEMNVFAIFFGKAGMLLSEFQEDYPNALRNEYSYLTKKYNFVQNTVLQWKFFRLRPANFPTIRIAQLARIILDHPRLFSHILEAGSIEELRTIFDVNIPEYWSDHYIFDRPSKFSEKRIGKSVQDSLLINVIAPIVFLYGKLRSDLSLTEKAIQLYSQLGPEKNKIIRNWDKLGVKASNAAHSQALIHLKEQYCNQHKCLQCGIGHQVMKEEMSTYALKQA